MLGHRYQYLSQSGGLCYSFMNPELFVLSQKAHNQASFSEVPISAANENEQRKYDVVQRKNLKAERLQVTCRNLVVTL